ncbi:MAG TPA: glycosyltransferase, partial [Gammaproteobacteria bacterium]|nr:glycosyltransferase [Gammaproteobacteria bacterium]
MNQRASNRIQFMGCEIDSLTREETLKRTLEWCHEADAKPRTLITLNAALLMMMKTNQELRQACNGGDIIVADGMPIVWSTRLLGTPLVDRVAGVDLMAS